MILNESLQAKGPKQKLLIEGSQVKSPKRNILKDPSSRLDGVISRVLCHVMFPKTPSAPELSHIFM